MSDRAARIRDLRARLSREAGRRDVVVETIGSCDRIRDRCRRHGATFDAAMEVVAAAAEARREELRRRVESLVTRGLRAVFGRGDLEFAFETKVSRGVFSTVPRVRSLFRGRTIETSIVDGHGGGVADVCSFVLRVVVLCLARPRVAPFLALDEPFRHVSGEYLRGCATLVRELARSAGIQVLMITHKPELVDAADVVHRVQNVDGCSVFECVVDSRDESFHARPGPGARPLERAAFEDLPLVPGEGVVRRGCKVGDAREAIEAGATEVTGASPGDPQATFERRPARKLRRERRAREVDS